MPERETVERVRALFRLDRCVYCGWPLAESADKGCAEDNCSMRPRPVRDAEAVSQDAALRALVRDHAEQAAALGAMREALALYLAEDADESRRLDAAGAKGSAAPWYVQHSMDLRRRARAALASAGGKP